MFLFETRFFYKKRWIFHGSHSLSSVLHGFEGPGSIIEHGKTGLIVPNEDHVALAKAIEELNLNPKYREKLAVGGRNRYQEAYTEERVIGQYLDLFERLKN